MSKQTTKMLVPMLRFPEFLNAREWSYKNGDKVFDPVSNKKHNSDLPILAITQEHGAVPRDKIDYNVIVTERSVKTYKVVDVGDFIISLRSFQGGIEYSNYKGICSPAYIILRKKIDIVEHYFKQYFKTSNFIQDLNRNIEGIRDGKMVSYKQFSALLLPVPLPEEQQKIADCLSSIDDLITVQAKKMESLKDHKKGLMQKLFPAVDEVGV
jgi:type I restriction enzyme S subunit